MNWGQDGGDGMEEEDDKGLYDEESDDDLYS